MYRALKLAGICLLTFVGACASQNHSKSQFSDTASPAGPAPSVETMEIQLQELADQIVSGLQRQRVSNVAMIDFTHLDGRVSELGRFLAEEMTTRLYRTSSFHVIERDMLLKVLREHELSLTGLMDESTAVQLGKLLSVDAIVTGSIADLEDFFRINARLISTETGTVFSVAATNLFKDQRIKNLSNRISYVAGAGFGQDQSSRAAGAFEPNQIFFKEDFAEYRDLDEAPSWGESLVIKKGDDGRMYLTSLVPGFHAAAQAVRFPENFTFEYDWSSFDGRSMGRGPYVRVPLELVDVEGNSFLLECGNWGAHLPGLSIIDFHEQSMNTFKLVKNGSTYSIYNNGERIQAGTFKEYGSFVGFRLQVPVVRSGRGQMFTNFIGKALPD